MTAPMTLTLNVTEDDITMGVPCDSNNCPVARAAARVLPKARSIQVGRHTLSVEIDDEFYSYPLSSATAERINTFDNTYAMEPFRTRVRRRE